METRGLDSFLRKSEFRGVLDVRREGEVVFAGAYGAATLRWDVPNTLETRFDVASISKLFTAVAVLGLVEQGRLDLDASIHAYADLGATTISPEVTLRQLLTHRSGIADIAEEDDGENYADVFAAVPCHVIVETADFVKVFGTKPANFAPGERYRYCNAGYLLAGLAVEHASGMGFRDYVQAEVFARAAMTRSAYFDKRYAVPDLAEGFDQDAEGRWEQNIYAYPPVGHADGGAFCTVGDLHAFLAALRGHELLSDDGTEAFFTSQVATEHEEVGQGFGLEFGLGPRAGRWWKEGCSEGASGIVQHMELASGPGVDFAVLANSSSGAWPVIEELQRRARGGS